MSPADLILVVDDDELFLQLMGVVIEGLGRRSCLVGSAEAAEHALTEETPTFVLCDLELGGGGGKRGSELIELIRIEYPSVKVVVVSGHSRSVVKAQVGRDDVAVLSKPFTIDQLSELLSEL